MGRARTLAQVYRHFGEVDAAETSPLYERVAVGSGIGRGKRLGASGEGEVVQRGEDHPGVPLSRWHRLDGAQRLVGLTQGDGDALVQR